MTFQQTLISAILSIALSLPGVLAGSHFVMTQCSCDNYSFARNLNINFIKPDGGEASISVQNNQSCDGHGKPNDCSTAWLTLNHCSDTGFCGVGIVCYNTELFDSDEFTINGATYKKNDYSNSFNNMYGSDFCRDLCLNTGYNPVQFEDGASYSYEISGFPEPQSC